MIFNFAEFIKSNLIGGFNNKTFNEQQVNIFAMNYLYRGQITQEDFEEIQLALYPIDEEFSEELK